MDRKVRNLFVLTVALVGCTAHAERAQVPKPRVLGADPASAHVRGARAAAVPVGEAAEEAANEPVGAVTLRDALAVALINNPRLAAYSWEVRAREAAILQAGLPPNPELKVEVENFGGSGSMSGFDGSENTISLSQLIELGGKRAKRRRLAEFERDIAGWDYETARIDTLTDVALRFVEVLAAQERHALAAELVEVGDQALRVVANQVKAGAVSSVEKSRAEVVLASSRVELGRRSRDLQSARARLAASWGSTAARFSKVSGALDENIAPLPSEATIVGQVDDNPDLARWTTELEAQRAAVALAEAQRVPDVTLGGGSRWLRETDDTAFVFEVSVPLPLFDRNQGGALQARRRLAKAGAQRRAAEVDVKATVQAAYQSLAATHDAVTTLRNVVLPKAESAFDGAAAAYRRGVFRYLDLLDTQRTLFALRSEYLDSLAAHHTAVAGVERLVGRSLRELRADDGEER